MEYVIVLLLAVNIIVYCMDLIHNFIKLRYHKPSRAEEKKDDTPDCANHCLMVHRYQMMLQECHDDISVLQSQLNELIRINIELIKNKEENNE